MQLSNINTQTRAKKNHNNRMELPRKNTHIHENNHEICHIFRIKLGEE